MITGSEIVEQLRKALRGEVEVHPVIKDQTWTKIWCGDVRFNVGDWLFTVFNDCNSLDYIDFVIAPNGREAEYADWLDDNGDSTNEDPIDLLTQDEFVALENLLRAAT